MKKIIAAVFALAMLTFTSCEFLGGIKLDNEKDVESLKKAITKNIKSGSKVREISISPLNDELTAQVGLITINYLNESNERRTAWVYLSPSMDTVDKEDNSIARKNEDGRAIDDYDFSAVFSNVNKAVQMVTDAGQNYSGLGYYRITFSSDPDKDEHKFSVRSKAGSGIQGRSIVTEYYEFDAIADAKGNVTVELPEEEEA